MTVRNENGVLQGVLPLARPCEVGFFSKYTLLGGDYLDFVTDPGNRAEVVGAVVTYLAQTKSNWGLADFRSQRKETAFLSVLECSLDELFAELRGSIAGLSFLLLPHQRYPSIPLPTTLEEYEKRLSKKFRWQLGYD